MNHGSSNLIKVKYFDSEQIYGIKIHPTRSLSILSCMYGTQISSACHPPPPAPTPSVSDGQLVNKKSDHTDNMNGRILFSISRGSFHNIMQVITLIPCLDYPCAHSSVLVRTPKSIWRLCYQEIGM